MQIDRCETLDVVRSIVLMHRCRCGPRIRVNRILSPRPGLDGVFLAILQNDSFSIDRPNA